MPDNTFESDNSIDNIMPEEAEEIVEAVQDEESVEDLINNVGVKRETDASAERDRIKEERIIAERAGILKNTKVSLLIGTDPYFDSLERPHKKPEASFEAEYVKKIIAPYDWKENIGDTIYINSGSSNFNKMFTKAIYAYVQLEKGEFPIMLYDRTAWKTAKYGFVLTNKFIHIHNRGIIPYKLRIQKIRRFTVDFGRDNNSWTYLSISRKGSRKSYPVFKSLNAERVLEITDFLIKMVYHLTPITPIGEPGTKVDLVLNGVMPDPPEKEMDDDDLLGQILLMIKMAILMPKETEHSDRIWTSMMSPDGTVKKADKKKEAEEAAASEPEEDDGGKKGKKGKKDKKGKKEGKEKPKKEKAPKEKKEKKEKKKKK